MYLTQVGVSRYVEELPTTLKQACFVFETLPISAYEATIGYMEVVLEWL